MADYADWLKPWRPAETTCELFRPSAVPAVPPGAIDRFTREQQTFLRRRVSLDAPDLRSITRDELPNYFSRNRGINEAAFVLTFIFQYYLRHLDGQDEPIRGNIRSFWYRKLARNLERLGLLEPPGGLSVSSPGKQGHYLLKTMENSFEALFKQEFFHYRDLEVYNHRERFRLMGRDNKRHLLYSEKEGLFWFCEEMHTKHSLHVYASRGSASWLDVDYLAEAIRKLDVRKLFVAAFTDYDPWGVFIAQTIKRKLETRSFGFRSISLQILTHLDLFDPAIIEENKRYLLNGHEDPKDPIHQVVMSWVNQGGGVNGEPYGIHVDHANWALVSNRVERWLNGKLEVEPIHLTLPEALRKKLEQQMGVDLS